MSSIVRPSSCVDARVRRLVDRATSRTVCRVCKQECAPTRTTGHCRNYGTMRSHAHLVHAVQDVDQVVPRGVPVVLIHAPVTDQGRKHLGEVVAGHDDGRPPHALALPPRLHASMCSTRVREHTMRAAQHEAHRTARGTHLAQADAVGVVAQVHQRPNHNLVVDGALQRAAGSRQVRVRVRTYEAALLPCCCKG